MVKATNADAVVEYEYDKITGLPTCERINGREITRKWEEPQPTPAGRPVSENLDGNTLHFGYNSIGALNHFQLNQHTHQHDALGRETVRESANGFILRRYTATGLLAQHPVLGRTTTGHKMTRTSATGTTAPYVWLGQTRYCYNDQILHTLF
ncbi:hypothetical protein [Burkholderia pseudomallei]|uniref:hypothetical protein n=1 Tax=Burkholderia pseudomallei TaxID=28450 RepID=UPI003D663B3E